MAAYFLLNNAYSASFFITTLFSPPYQLTLHCNTAHYIIL